MLLIMKYSWDKQTIEYAVSISDSYSDTLRNLNIPVRGRNRDTLKRKIAEF